MYFNSFVLFSFETFRNEKKLGFSKRNGRVCVSVREREREREK